MSVSGRPLGAARRTPYPEGDELIVAQSVESSGDIETVCKQSPIRAGDVVELVFRAYDDAEPPFNIKIKSPSGKVIVERVLRELPTGKPQSAPPVQFTVSAPGEYQIQIKQLYGKQQGDATLRVV
jgi:hypothetical protein